MNQLKLKPKFGPGHFPVGTVIDFESNFMPFLAPEDREFEDQMYGIIRDVVVLEVVCNAPGSWVVVLDHPHPGDSNIFKEPHHGVNIAWVVGIKKRGKDSCAPKPVHTECSSIITMCLAEVDNCHEHHYDIDRLQETVYHELNGFRGRSRKKIKEVTRRLLPRFKISRKEAMRRERDFWDMMYADD